MKIALQKAGNAARAAVRNSARVARSVMDFLLSAVLWIVILFAGGAAMIVNGAMIMFGHGPAFMVAGVFMLSACFLLKRAVTDGS